MKTKIETANAPKPAGTYSQAVKTEHTIYLAGQIPVAPNGNDLVSNDFRKQVLQVFKNLEAVCQAAGYALNDISRIMVYLTDLNDFPILNEVMSELFQAPYPARTTIGISALPKGAKVEIDGIIAL